MKETIGKGSIYGKSLIERTIGFLWKEKYISDITKDIKERWRKSYGKDNENL